MWRTVFRLGLPVLTLWLTWLPAAQAAITDSSSEGDGSKTAALPYTVAFLSTIVILVILCMPSRKRSSSE